MLFFRLGYRGLSLWPWTSVCIPSSVLVREQIRIAFRCQNETHANTDVSLARHELRSIQEDGNLRECTELCLFEVDVLRAIARKTCNEARDDTVPL